jgi:uncharacterized RDD family membrane protein YckC
VVAGFWIRLASDVLDAILLGLFGLCLSLPFRSALYRLGENGVWIGLCVTFLYAGILQSRIGQGQSLAKRLLKIQVRTMDGGYLTLWMSFFRYSVIALIFYNEWIGLGIVSVFPFLNNQLVQTSYSAAVAALLAGTMLMVPFHPLKRGLHDLIAGSVVVYKSRFDHHALAALDDPGRARRSYIIAGGSGLAMVVATFVLGQGLTASATMGRLLRAQGRIANQTSLENVSVQERWSRSFGPNSRTTTTLVVNGFLLKSSYDDAARQSLEAKKAADALLDAYGGPLDFDGINVTVRTGYNIGITNFTQSNQHFFDRDGLPFRNR